MDTYWMQSKYRYQDSAKSDLRITGETKPDYIQKGHFFALDGTIKSTSLNLTEVYGAILGENGRPVEEITVHPDRTTYRLNNEIDNSLIVCIMELKPSPSRRNF